MILYIVICWLGCLLTLVLLIQIYRRARYLFIKPSVITVVYLHVIIQWSATIDSSRLYEFLPFPWELVIMLYGVPISVICGSLYFSSKKSREIWEKIQVAYSDNNPTLSNSENVALVILLTFHISFVIYYLSEVPFNSTGLVAVITDPLNSAQAREDSLKLVKNVIIQYGFLWMASAISPMIAVIAFKNLRLGLKERRYLQILRSVALLLYILLAVSLTGARSFAVNIVLVIIISGVIRNGFRVKKPLRVSVGILIALIPATLLSLFREGREISAGLIWEYLTDSIFRRAFYGPMEVGTWYVHYAQTNGFFGVAAVPKLAWLFGVVPIDATNFIGRLYETSSLESVSADATFLLSYYSYFGLFAYLICMLALWILDFSVLAFSKLHLSLLLPSIATSYICCLSFASSDFTTVIGSHGFLTTIIVALLVNYVLSTRQQRAVSKIEVIGNIKTT